MPGGWVDVSYGYSHVSAQMSETYNGAPLGGAESADTRNAISIQGAGAVPIFGWVGAQLDARYGRDWVANSTPGESSLSAAEDSADATAHLFARTNRWLAGVFVGDAGFRTDGSAYGGVKRNLFGGGGEEQLYLGPVTVGVAADVAEITNWNTFGHGGHPTFWSVRTDLRYFVNDRLGFGAHAGYMDGSFTNFNAAQGPGLWTVGVGGEYRPRHLPVSVTLAYEHGEGSIDSQLNLHAFATAHQSLSANAVRVGLRWNWGGGLVSRDRHGASLNSFHENFGGPFASEILSDYPDIGPY